MHNGYNYRTLNPWEQTALEHLSAIIGEIIGAGFEDPNNLMERVNNMVLELSSPDNLMTVDEEIAEILDPSPYSDRQPKYICYGASGEDGDKEINPSWDDSDSEEEDGETQVPGFQNVDYEDEEIPW